MGYVLLSVWPRTCAPRPRPAAVVPWCGTRSDSPTQARPATSLQRADFFDERGTATATGANLAETLRVWRVESTDFSGVAGDAPKGPERCPLTPDGGHHVDGAP